MLREFGRHRRRCPGEGGAVLLAGVIVALIGVMGAGVGVLYWLAPPRLPAAADCNHREPRRHRGRVPRTGSGGSRERKSPWKAARGVVREPASRSDSPALSISGESPAQPADRGIPRRTCRGGWQRQRVPFPSRQGRRSPEKPSDAERTPRSIPRLPCTAPLADPQPDSRAGRSHSSLLPAAISAPRSSRHWTRSRIWDGYALCRAVPVRRRVHPRKSAGQFLGITWRLHWAAPRMAGPARHRIAACRWWSLRPLFGRRSPTGRTQPAFIRRHRSSLAPRTISHFVPSRTRPSRNGPPRGSLSRTGWRLPGTGAKR